MVRPICKGCTTGDHVQLSQVIIHPEPGVHVGKTSALMETILGAPRVLLR